MLRLLALLAVVGSLALLDASSSPSTATAAGARAAAIAPLGPSVTLGPVLKRTHCLRRGALPDAGCTPGARFSKATKARVCRAGYSATVRNVSARTRRAVYAAYAIHPNYNGQNGELDHLVSLELGGSNSRANLFPEAARPRLGAHEKDRLENRLHDEICDGRTTLRNAQQLIAGDWVAAYNARFG